MRGISYSNVLKNLDLNVFEKETCVIAGLVDSGISTIADILCGNCIPDSGRIWLYDQAVYIDDLRDKHKFGIFSITDTPALFPYMSVAENFYSIPTVNPSFVIRTRNMFINRTQDLLNDYGLNVSPKAMVSTLSDLDTRRLELLKLVISGAKLIIANDFWSTLSLNDQQTFFSFIDMLKEKNDITFIFISYRTDTLLNFADRIFFIRDGLNIKCVHKSEFDEKLALQILIGQDYLPIKEKIKDAESKKIVFSANSVSFSSYEPLNFSVSEGEIFGIYDITGKYIRDFYSVLQGKMDYSGEFILNGRRFNPKVGWPFSKAGMVMLDSSNDLIQSLSIIDNIALVASGSGVNYDRLKKELILDLAVMFGDIPYNRPIYMLNLSPYDVIRLKYYKWFYSGAGIFVCYQPISSGDIMLKEAVFSTLELASRKGISVICLTSTPNELDPLCSRIITP